MCKQTKEICESESMKRTQKQYISELQKEVYVFQCPACGCLHYADQRWTLTNNNEVRPTFRPSFMIRSQPNNGPVSICHSFVTSGLIQFLGDSTHKMTGMTVALPVFSEE